MPEWIVLGSAHALPSPDHANTHFLLHSEERALLIDAPCNVEQQLHRAGVPLLSITDLLLTHFHPDHVAGVPQFLMDSWLAGRAAPLHLYANQDVLDRLQTMMSLYRWEDWPDFFPIEYHKIPQQHLSTVMEISAWKVQTSPVKHTVPTIGLRITFADGTVLAYSSDTAPCKATVELARDADYLFHEASGEMDGHSSAAQAGEIAALAGAKRLYLVHTDPRERPFLKAEAQKTFSGKVVVAEDLMRLEVGK